MKQYFQGVWKITLYFMMVSLAFKCTFFEVCLSLQRASKAQHLCITKGAGCAPQEILITDVIFSWACTGLGSEVGSVQSAAQLALQLLLYITALLHLEQMPLWICICFSSTIDICSGGCLWMSNLFVHLNSVCETSGGLWWDAWIQSLVTQVAECLQMDLLAGEVS